MRYVKIEVGNGYCGCNKTFYKVFPLGTTDTMIDQHTTILAYENAEDYSYCATGWGNSFDSWEEEEEYFAEATGFWKEISKEQYEEER